MKEQSISFSKASFFSILGRAINIIISIILMGIFARKLMPEEFGIIAIAMVFLNFFQLVGGLGIGPAIIQNKELTKYDYDNIFSYTVYTSLIITIIFALSSFVFVIIFKNDIYFIIIPAISISMLFSILNIVPNAILFKMFKYKFIAIRTLFVTTISSLVSIYFLYNGFRVYSLIIYYILISILSFVWNMTFVRLKFFINFDFNCYKNIRKYSRFQLIHSIVNYFSRNTDNILIGKFFGEKQLGFYNKSYQLMNYPIQNIIYSIGPVLHPKLSQHQNDTKAILEKYTVILRSFSTIGVWISVYCFVASKELIYYFYGPNWYNSIIPFHYLSFSIWAQILLGSTSSIFKSLNKVKLLSVTTIINSIIIIISIVIGVNHKNINNIAYNIMIAYNLSMISTFAILSKYAFGNNKIVQALIAEMIFYITTLVCVIFIDSYINIKNIFFSGLYKFLLTTFITLLFMIIFHKYKNFRELKKI